MKSVFLYGNIKYLIMLLFNVQLLEVLFFDIREVKFTVSECANLVVRECIIFQ